MSANPYSNPSLKDQLSTTVSRNFPRWTVVISRGLSGLTKSLWVFLVQLFRDAIGH